MKVKEIIADFKNTLGHSSPSYSTVAKQNSKFTFDWESLKHDLWESLKDYPNSSQPRCASTQKMIVKVLWTING